MAREKGPGSVEAGTEAEGMESYLADRRANKEQREASAQEIFEALKPHIDSETMAVLTTVLTKAREGGRIDVDQYEEEFPGFKRRLYDVQDLMTEVNGRFNDERIGDVMKADAERSEDG